MYGGEVDKIHFVASLPNTSRDICIGNGSRVQLEIPDSEIAEVIKLVAYKGKAFAVTIEEIPSGLKDLSSEPAWSADEPDEV